MGQRAGTREGHRALDAYEGDESQEGRILVQRVTRASLCGRRLRVYGNWEKPNQFLLSSTATLEAGS